MEKHPDQRIPIIEPLLMALRRRTVVVPLVTIIITLLAMRFPEVAAFREELALFIMVFILGFMGNQTVGDWLATKTLAVEFLEEADFEKPLNEQIKDVSVAAIQELASPK